MRKLIAISVTSLTAQQRCSELIRTGDYAAYDLEITFTDLVSITGTCNLKFVRSDGQIINTAGTIVGNKITHTLTTGETAVRSPLNLYVQFADSNLFTPLLIQFTGVSDVPSGTPLPNTNEYPDWLKATADTVIATGAANVAAGNAVTATGNANAATSAANNAESARAIAEGSRVTADGNRTIAEGGRVSAEAARVITEGTRVTADGNRTIAEQGRVSGEQGRVSVEGSRVTAESARAAWHAAYDAGHAYLVGEKLAYNGSSYICILNSTGNLPTNGTYFLLMAAKGDQGIQGIAGGAITTAAQLPIADPGDRFVATHTEAALLELEGKIAQIANQSLSPIFGVRFALASSNPVGERTNAAVGYSFTPGVGVAGTSSFDGSALFDWRLCNRAGGVVTAYYGEPGFVPTNDTFVEIPSGYYKRWVDATYEYYQISKSEFPGSKLHNSFRRGGVVKDYIYLAAYKASYDGASKHESKSGALPDVNVSRTTSRTRSRARGVYAAIQDIHARDWLALLFSVETASRDSQTVSGRGLVDMPYSSTHVATVTEITVNRIILANASADAFVAGQEFSIGTGLGSSDVAADRTITAINIYDANNKSITFSGAAVSITIGNIAWTSRQKNGKTDAIAQGSGVAVGTSGKSAIRYRGIENPWGNVWEWVDNLNIRDNRGYSDPNGRIALYSDTDFGTNYTPYAVKFPAANGYFKRPMMDAAIGVGCLPSDVTGGLTTHYSDYHYQSAGDRASLVGGSWYGGSYAGLWYWYLNSAASGTSLDFGSRLLEIPV